MSTETPLLLSHRQSTDDTRYIDGPNLPFRKYIIPVIRHTPAEALESFLQHQGYQAWQRNADMLSDRRAPREVQEGSFDCTW